VWNVGDIEATVSINVLKLGSFTNPALKVGGLTKPIRTIPGIIFAQKLDPARNCKAVFLGLGFYPIFR
jgi:hypothetical protein